MTVTPGVGRLAVSWTAVSGADGYKVQWKSGSQAYDSSRQQVISTTSSTIPDLDGGTAYSVQVIATATGAADGDPSDTKTGTPTLPAISIANGSGGEAAGAVTFNVSLNASYHQAVSATWSTSGGTATAGTDYNSVSSATVTILVGSTIATLSVTVQNDSADELAETFMVTLSSPANATLAVAHATATGTIMDDDLPTVSISAGASPVTEGTPATFTVRRGIADPAALVVRLDSSQIGAFISATLPSSVTIAGGSKSATVTIATDVDSVGEPDGSVTVAIAANAASYQVGSPASATVAIEDDDASFTLDIAGGGTVAEDVGNATFTVTLTSDDPVSEPISVEWRTVNGTAMAGSDYVADNGTLMFAPGAIGAARIQQVTVAITNDTRDENDETFTVMLRNESGAGAGIGTRSATATITDNDVPALSIDDATADEDAGSIVFDVSLSLASDLVISASYAASAVSATAGSDFTAATATGTVTFPADARSAKITIALINDSLPEDRETFTVTLSGPSSGATLGDATATGTIDDDDRSFTLDIAGGGIVGEGDSATFTVTLTPQPASATPTEEITVDWATADGTATERLGLHGRRRHAHVCRRRDRRRPHAAVHGGDDRRQAGRKRRGGLHRHAQQCERSERAHRHGHRHGDDHRRRRAGDEHRRMPPPTKTTAASRSTCRSIWRPTW